MKRNNASLGKCLSSVTVYRYVLSWYFVVMVFSSTFSSAENDLVVPAEVQSVDGVLNISLQLERATIETSDYTISTRTLNGTFPGPTIRLRPGDILQLRFLNALENQGLGYVHNRFSAPDETNLHFHGLHISGELPSDDTTLVVRPGQEYTYQIRIPPDHMPGTFWAHPHRHGSTTLQVGGGAALAVIIDYPEDQVNDTNLIPSSSFLPPEPIRSAREVILMIQRLDINEFSRIARRYRDQLFSASITGTGTDRRGEGSTTLTLLNGQVNPIIRASAGEWLRFRIIFANWKRDMLQLNFSGGECQMYLLAKDGIYVPDAPRLIQRADIVAAGRADLLVQCSGDESTNDSVYQLLDGDKSIASIVIGSSGNAVGNNSADGVLPRWNFEYPSYLSNLLNVDASENCSCITQFGGSAINGIPFDESKVLHQSFLGAVAERTIKGFTHPYHQHVYPFQVIEIKTLYGETTNYMQVGDWHDTVMMDGIIRFQPKEYVTKMVVHCHILDHEDEGMMGIELVTDGVNCMCTPPQDFGLKDWTIAVTAVACFVVFLIVILAYLFWKRRFPFRPKSHDGEPGEPISQEGEGDDDGEGQEQDSIIHQNDD